MNLHEYQAKALLQEYGIPIPPGGIAASAAEAEARARELGGAKLVVKAQVHAGQRGPAGGVRIVDSAEQAGKAASEMLGKTIVTPQTGRDGIVVNKVYVEQAADIAREIYAAVLVDRSKARVSVILNREGGANVEAALRRRDSLIEMPVTGDGLDQAAVTQLAGDLGITPEQAARVGEILRQARHAFIELDASLIEFNPLAVTEGGDILALDLKMVLDDNALSRHPELEALRDDDDVDPRAREASRFEINYTRMDGNIGIMTTGAGLGLAAIDMVKTAGGEPANFMDVRPMASRSQVADGIALLLGDKRIRVVLVLAVGGGLLHCDTIAEGIATAVRKSSGKIPIVYNGAGTGKEISELTLRNQGVAVALADSMEEAAREAVRIAGTGAR